jgi:hypothetical protein
MGLGGIVKIQTIAGIFLSDFMYEYAYKWSPEQRKYEIPIIPPNSGRRQMR